MPETDRFDCVKCGRDNGAENMVQCDGCDEHYHYSCAGVDEKVESSDVTRWFCVKCLEKSEQGSPLGASLADFIPPATTASQQGGAAAVPTSASGPTSTAADPLEDKVNWMRAQQAKMERDLQKRYQEELQQKIAEMRRVSTNAIQSVRGMDQPEGAVGGEAGPPTGANNPAGEFWDNVIRDLSSISFGPCGAAMGGLTSSGPVMCSSSTPVLAGAANFALPPYPPQTSAGVSPPASSTVNPNVPSTGSAPLTIQYGNGPIQPLSGQTSAQTVSACPIASSLYPPPVYAGGSFVANVSGAVPSAPMSASSSMAPPFGSIGTSTPYSGFPPTVSSAAQPYPPPGAMPVSSGLSIPPLVSQVPCSGFGIASTAASISSGIPSYPNPYPGLGGLYGGPTAASMAAGASSGIASYPNPYPGLGGLYGGPTAASMAASSSGAMSTPSNPNPGLNGLNGEPAVASTATSTSGAMQSQLNSYPGLDRLYGGTTEPTPVRTRDQLIARQVISKDLPTFTGEPEDWPLFYSSFMNSTNACGYSADENMFRLRKALQGKAKQAVSGRLSLPRQVPQIMNTLYSHFGRPELILQALLDKVDEYTAVKANDFERLVDFGTLVENICDHVVSTNQAAQLYNPDLQKRLASKLPENLLLDWGLYRRQCGSVDLRYFAAFMAKVTEAALEVAISTGKPKQARVAKVANGKPRNFLNTHTEVEPTKKESPSKETSPSVVCLACNGANHKVKDCATFRKWQPENRWKTVQDHHLCRTCLGKHGRFPCKSQAKCGVDGCDQRHHSLLHAADMKAKDNQKQGAKAATTKAAADGVNAHQAASQSTLLRFLPVKVSWNGSSVETYAFLDDGSEVTLMERTLAEQLGINNGIPMPLTMSWTNNVVREEEDSEQVAIEIAGLGKQEQFAVVGTRTVRSLGIREQTLNYQELVRQYPHLKGLPVSSYESSAPGILIGSNNPNLLSTLKLREGQFGDPVAAKTRLGWTIFGCKSGEESSTNFTYHICETSPDEDLHNLVKKHFALESMGVAATKEPESDEDKRARQMLEQLTKRVAGGFVTGLLWRYDIVMFPNSYPMAFCRLLCFERRMKADPELGECVRRQIHEYLECGYIHVATEAELNAADQNRVWYLPLGAVRNPKKPGKVRMIWDAAAKVGGISLNRMLLKGPDMLVPLPAVLCRFREHAIAVCGDLKQMFHQFKIRPEDAQSQRFLYREDPSQPVQIFVMDVGTFGATCSPSQAQYIKNLNAQEHADEFPRAARAIMQNHYVDDYLDSFDDEEEAIKVALEVKEVHARGGFEIRNWHSNSDELLRRVGEPRQQQQKAISLDAEDDAERVLGLRWMPREDALAFATSLEYDGMVLTKRNILRCVMSLFDSQGILSHITIQGRMLIQELWRTSCGWDEEVNETIRRRWCKWIQLFKKVSQIQLPRAYFPGFSAAKIGEVELHIFTDASEEAYACTAYFRAVIDGKVYCTQVMAKARVAPLKSLSVPRLELMAALLGARLAKTIREYHTYTISRTVFWTDSTVTLAWIQSEHRRYRQFVGFRVAEILSLTEPEQWRHVPTQHNVADEATKWGKGPSTDVNSRWFKGPDFLYQPESEWPRRTSTAPLETEEEIRTCLVHQMQSPKELIKYERFSKWERLQRAVGWIYRYMTNCKRQAKGETRITGCLKQEELTKAENCLFRAVQAAKYPDEVGALKGERKKVIDRSSKLFQLTPYLDEHGVMRVDGRIGAASYVTYDFKYPIILPREHRLTELVVDWYHRDFKHTNHETVCNEVRQRFHISELRPLIRWVSKRCQFCKIYNAQPQTPREAPLPEARLSAMTRPFSYVGLDYFGPIQVKVGRSLVKRWVALFTCLTLRAVHLEVVHSLSTQSCKMAVRRFLSRRGAPLEIYSDNGTNFQGASRELREEIAALGKSLEATFTNQNTKWLFNPPSAPHFGGSWERLVRSVKVAMASISSTRNPDDETFVTVVVEAESMINSRPLTYLPLDRENQEAITPNHFLLLSSTGVKQPPRTIKEPMKVARTDYDLAREMLDQFWTRWIREFLPTLTKRTKWFDEAPPVKVGDLVVIIEDGQRNGWIRGQIVSVVPGRDGRIRRAGVQLADGKILERPVAKLAVLDASSGGNAKDPEAEVARYGSGDVGESGTTAGATKARPAGRSEKVTDRTAKRHRGTETAGKK